MCTPAVLDFVKSALSESDVAGKVVLEVGSFDVNGSARPAIEALGPDTYVGVDMAEGPGVDEVCDVSHLVDRFGDGFADVVISTEMVEHVYDWRAAFTALKTVVAPGGVLLVTTRSYGFHPHGCPGDYWRYELDDMKQIFADFTIERLQSDPLSPGVFVRAKRPLEWVPQPLDGPTLYSIITRRRTEEVPPLTRAGFFAFLRARKVAASVLPVRIKEKLHLGFPEC